MFAMTFIISGVVLCEKTGILLGRLTGFGFAGTHLWQTSIQASIPRRINNVSPKLCSENSACLFRTRERSDS